MSYALFLLCFLLTHNASPVTSDDVPSSEGWRNGSCSMRFQHCDKTALCEDRRHGNESYFRCYCLASANGDGYLNGTNCTTSGERTQCARKLDCHQYAFCNQTVNYCQCEEGFVGDGGRKCEDVNECLSNRCDAHATCANNPGSFTCTCNYNDHYIGDGFTCEHHCGGDHHCHPDAKCIKLTSQCRCKPGFLGDGLTCTDINECDDEATCEHGSTCINSPGSYTCQCNNGYHRTSNKKPCTEVPRDCEEIPQATGSSKDGHYVIDPDFTGPTSQFTVWCEFHEGYAVTEVPVLGTETREAKGDNFLDYGTDLGSLRALVDRAGFCYQDTHTACHRDFAYAPDFLWLDALNVSHTSWAGSSQDGMCGCGQLRKCDGCNCGKNTGKDQDWGRFVDKTLLPVTFVRFSAHNDGTFEVGPLRCGPRTFDIPIDCNGWKEMDRGNNAYYIDVDGPSGEPPFLVFCDLDTYPHVGVTELQLTQTEVWFTERKEEVALHYIQGLTRVTSVLEVSAFCSQHVQYTCTNSGITGMRVYVTVTPERRNLTYFPGASGMEDSCPCGVTHSCEDRALRCNCDIEDGMMRRDLGHLVDKEDLPVVGVAGNGGEGRYSHFTVSHLRCAPLQFGISPNCEKLRSEAHFKVQDYTYLIDPDGPDVSDSGKNKANVKPFLVECEFSDNPVHGITIVHHTHEMQVMLEAHLSLVYLQADIAQLEALKGRSTFCLQHVHITCQRFSLGKRDQNFWLGINKKKSRFVKTLPSCVERNGKCMCTGDSSISHDGGFLDDLRYLPVTEVDFSKAVQQLTESDLASANITIGPLRCSELFPTCEALQKFIARKTSHLGETLPEVESLVSIDPDGAGPVPPFEVQCSWPDTVVTPDVTYGYFTTRSNAKSKCFDIIYRDHNGNQILPAQLIALRDRSRNCFQTLDVECQSAAVSGMVNYTTCGGVTQTGWAGSGGRDSCACGVGGHCQGGPSFKCNCDLEDSTARHDGAVIIDSNRIPVCQVCLSLAAIPDDMRDVIRRRRLAFRISALNCHPGRGRHIEAGCQDVRAKIRNLQSERTEIVYMYNESPVPVGCKMVPHPPIGLLEVFPQNQVFSIENVASVSIDVYYYAVDLNILHLLMMRHVYCSQRIYFFCLPPDANINPGASNHWVDVEGKRSQQWDVLTNEEISRSSVCRDYPAQCQSCGPPRGLVVYHKSSLPITKLLLDVTGNFTIIVKSTTCTDVFENCYEIMVDKGQKKSTKGDYPIDPDGPGGVDPFVVECDFQPKDVCAVTKVTVDPAFLHGVEGQNVTAPGGLKQIVTYGSVTPSQVAALANVSRFCWQPVHFDCHKTALINNGTPPHSYYSLLLTHPSLSFGTGSLTNVTGCACSLTGTCPPGHTCHCDAGSDELSSDGGVVSKKEELPILEVAIGGQTSSRAIGVMSVGDVSCGNTACQQFPRDCQEALDWGTRNGISYQRSGEYFINPKPAVCQPFPVFCQMDLANSVGVTRIVSKTKEGAVLTPGEISHHDYFAPSLEQIRCLIDESQYCVQPVVYECYKAKLLGGGVRWRNEDTSQWQQYWGGASPDSLTCACHEDQGCGGLDSAEGQRDRKCNCDAADEQWRKDAGIFTNKSHLPVTFIDLAIPSSDPDTRVKVTVGDLLCSQSEIDFDECSEGFHDCGEQATCQNTAAGYTCRCQQGWEGQTQDRLVNQSLPVANGRQCIDNNECTFNECPLGQSTCTNIPGSFFCTCHSGYEQTGSASCTDIDECATNTHMCDENARCINEQGRYKCLCNRNFRGSGYQGDCHSVGICTIFGDPHTSSFDERWNHFQGSVGCRYVIVSDECQPGIPGSITVVMKPWQQDPPVQGFGEFTWVKSVEVRTKGRVIEMLLDGLLRVDGVWTSGFVIDGLTIFHNGLQLILLLDDGLEVYWDGREVVEVVVSTDFKDKLCGLCGNFNGDPQDDWTIGPACPDAGSLTDNFDIFGYSWLDMETDTCHADCDASQSNVTDCVIDREVAEQECGKVYDVTRSPFKDCLERLPMVDDLLDSCVYDLCRVKNHVQHSLCFHAESVVDNCELNLGIAISDWRRPDFCGMNCPGNTTYMACGPDLANPGNVQRSCLHVRNPDLEMTGAVRGCAEGCFCEAGFVQEGYLCINEDSCGCFVNGTYLQLGSTATTGDCRWKAECRRGGILHFVEVLPLQCGDNAFCTAVNKTAKCSCLPGFTGDGFTCIQDGCKNVTCKLNTYCVDGHCLCLPGYFADCNCDDCQDIDECATRTDRCNDKGQICVNTNGSYYCDCDIGYVNLGNSCEDIDECALGIAQCPAHSECFNRPGMFACMCCSGYTMNSDGECMLLSPNDREYVDPSGPGYSCCSCNTPVCDTPGPVCGTDGKTYLNIRAMVVQTCLHEHRVQPMYMGRCTGNCSLVECLQPHAVCKIRQGRATCVCPQCTDIHVRREDAVCGSNGIVYRSECEFQAVMCFVSNREVVVVPSLSRCLGPTGWVGRAAGGSGGAGGARGAGGGGRGRGRLAYNSTEWSACSVTCGEGVVTTTQTLLRPPYTRHTVTAHCYKSCTVLEECTPGMCNSTGQECIATHAGPRCVCTPCDSAALQPVCGQVEEEQTDTFPSLCHLRARVCQLNAPHYFLLLNESCHATPLVCNVTQNFYRRMDDDGCYNKVPYDYGECKGGCGRAPLDCCQPSSHALHQFPFRCPGNRTEYRQVKVITSCRCVPPVEVAR